MSLTVEVEREKLVARITFRVPPHNHASPRLIRLIADALDEVDADPGLRCSVLASEGRAFCAGADLAGDDAMAGGDGMAAVATLYQEAERLFRRRKPMVVAVQGAAVGAGLGLAVAADFRVAGPRARFSANFVRLGFHPGFALTYTLPRLIGAQRAALMMLTARRVKPDEALSWGLVDEVASEDGLLHRALTLAAEIADNAPLSLMRVKEALDGDLPQRAAAAMASEHAGQSALRTTADYAEGVASVFARRPADFRGR